jgi:hypothetical protein
MIERKELSKEDIAHRAYQMYIEWRGWSFY